MQTQPTKSLTAHAAGELQSLAAAEQSIQRKIDNLRRYDIDKLGDLAVKEAEKAVHSFNKGIEAMAKSGLYLLAAKARLGHGEWLPYLEGLGISQPTAHRRMRLARAAELLPELQADGEPWDMKAALLWLDDAERADKRATVGDAVSFDDLEEDDALPAMEHIKGKKPAGKMDAGRRLRQKSMRLVDDIRAHAHEDVGAVTEEIANLIHVLQELLEELAEAPE